MKKSDKPEYTYEQKIEFIKSIYCAARLISDETGSSWELMLAQAAQETGWGEKVLPGTNNIYNIKADNGWHGESKVFYVSEREHGKEVWGNYPFRKYASHVESLRDRANFLKSNSRYAKFGFYDSGVKGKLGPEAQALQDAGYATDPNYAAALVVLFNGPTMRRSIKEAQAEGCGPILPIIEVTLKDGAKMPIARAKVSATQNGKTAEIATDASGCFIMRITPNSGNIQLKVFDDTQKIWIDLDPIVIPSPAKSTTVTLIAPTFVIHTSTREHEKILKKDKKAAPKAAPAVVSTAGGGSNGMKTHVIKAGQSLALIGKMYGVGYKSIADANNIKSPFVIRPEQVLKIPMPGAAAPSTHKGTAATASGAHADKSTAQAAVRPTAPPSRAAAPEVHTIYSRNAAANPQTDVMHSSQAPWMKFAEEEFKKGVKRQAGTTHNDPRILEYFTATPGLGRAATIDETPYCAAFANWCLIKSGFHGNNSARAHNFVSWGRPTTGNKPALGAVAVIRFADGSHHVTFVAGTARGGHHIATLGGNQGAVHEVSHSSIGPTFIIAYRYPENYPDNPEDYILHDVRSDHAPMTASSTH